MIDIVLVSRGRPELLDQCIQSIYQTVDNKNCVYVGCDMDDESNILLHRKYYQYPVTFVYNQRTTNLHEYINKLATLAVVSASTSASRYLFVLNDDCILTTKGWDTKALELLNDFCYGRTHDNSIDKISNEYASFPIISHSCFKKLGFFMDETFGNHGSDVITYKIYQQAGLVIDLPCVTIDHIYHNSPESLRKREQDKTATDMINRTFQGGFSINKLLSLDVSDKVARLNG